MLGFGIGCTCVPLWLITAKNTDCSTGPLAHPFTLSLAPLTRSLAPDCSLCSRPPLRSLVRSLAYFAHSLARGTVNDGMAILSCFFQFSTVVRRLSSVAKHFHPKLSFVSWCKTGSGSLAREPKAGVCLCTVKVTHNLHDDKK